MVWAGDANGSNVGGFLVATLGSLVVMLVAMVSVPMVAVALILHTVHCVVC